MVFIVNITINIKHEEPGEDVPVTLAGYSLWLEFQASVMACLLRWSLLADRAELECCARSLQPLGLQCLLRAMKTACGQLGDGFRVKLWE